MKIPTKHELLSGLREFTSVDALLFTQTNLGSVRVCVANLGGPPRVTFMVRRYEGAIGTTAETTREERFDDLDSALTFLLDRSTVQETCMNCRDESRPDDGDPIATCSRCGREYRATAAPCVDCGHANHDGSMCEVGTWNARPAEVCSCDRTVAQ